MPTAPPLTGEPHPRHARRGLLTLLLGFFSSVPVGIAWFVLLFFYCSIGSAVPQVRQLPALDMTEFQWFHWWPFQALIVLFCTSLIVVTIRRIHLRLVNAGVWTIHTGIILLCVGSFYYFGTKIEGDAPVFRRRVGIAMPGLSTPESLVALPGAQKRVRVGNRVWQFAVQSTNTSWPILSDEHKGETAYAVNVLIRPPTGDAYVRQLLAGYPQYTEDIIPGQGRAIKSIGRKLVDEELVLSLEYEPQEFFHVMETWALYVRRVGEKDWSQRPIKNFPRYHDYVASRDQVFFEPGALPPLRSMDIAVPAAAGGDALAKADVRATGYLRYAHVQRRWREGEGRLNPVAKLTFLTDHAGGRSYELVAFDPRNNQVEGGIAEFVWLGDASETETLPTDFGPMLFVSVPGTDLSLDVPITRETVVGHDGAFTPVEGTALAFRILNIQDNLVLPGSGDRVSIAMVEIETPEGSFTRMVADQPKMTRDMATGSDDPHAPHAKKPEDADPRITMRYRPGSAPIILAAHPGGLYFVYNAADGRAIGREVEPGETVDIVAGLSIRIDDVWIHAVADVKPFVVPRSSRRSDAGENFAMVRLEVDTGRGAQSQWVAFSPYVLPDETYSYSGRFAYAPKRFRLADGGLAEVVFSRERRQLPCKIAMEDFALDTHVGGYTGKVLTIRNYVSRLRFLDGGKWSDTREISVNAPTEYGGYSYFQSMWDKPSAERPGGGMNYTGLGVGNRNGVVIQLAGCCLAVVGMLFAFYVKPILKRPKSEQPRARTADVQQSGVGVPSPAEAVEV